MANADNPRGFTPVRHLTGGTIRANEYRIADDYATAIFAGDLVKLVAGGGIEVAAAGDRVLGVFQGCHFVNDSGEQVFNKYWPAAQSVQGSYGYAYVYDDPNIVFRAQADGAVAAADVGQLADMISTHAGSTGTGRSGQEVNSTTGTGTAQLRILDLVKDPENAWGANVELEVQIYEHELTAADQATPGV